MKPTPDQLAERIRNWGYDLKELGPWDSPRALHEAEAGGVRMVGLTRFGVLRGLAKELELNWLRGVK